MKKIRSGDIFTALSVLLMGAAIWNMAVWAQSDNTPRRLIVSFGCMAAALIASAGIKWYPDRW